MENAWIYILMSVAVWLIGVALALWILWAIIRGAVLSALRKHRRDIQEESLFGVQH